MWDNGQGLGVVREKGNPKHAPSGTQRHTRDMSLSFSSLAITATLGHGSRVGKACLGFLGAL